MKTEGNLDQFSSILKFDTRVAKYSLERGLVKESELKQHLDSLPDCSSNVERVRIEDNSHNGAAN